MQKVSHAFTAEKLAIVFQCDRREIELVNEQLGYIEEQARMAIIDSLTCLLDAVVLAETRGYLEKSTQSG